MSAPSTGATRSLTPTVAGTYVYTVTGTNANCVNQVNQTVVVNPNPVVTTTTATPVTGLTVGSTYLLGASGLSSTKDLDSAAVGALVAGKFVGNSRIDGFPIFQVVAITTGFSIAASKGAICVKSGAATWAVIFA
jgi:hypothetical protein